MESVNLDALAIQEILPHRYPFLLVDRIVEIEYGVGAVGLKQVSMGEPYFQGHFPEYPVMPGVLIIEALAQVGAVALLGSDEHTGKIALFEVSPEDLGLPRAKLEDLQGGDGEANARALRAVLQGRKGAFRDIALFTSAAALLVAGRADSLKDGLSLASQALDSGQAQAKLDGLVRITNAEVEAEA